MDYFPFFFDLKDKPVLLVGAGGVALRKARLLTKAGAALVCVAPAIEPELEQLLATGNGRWHPRTVQDTDVDGVCLVVCATNDRAVNAHISALCQQRFLPVNVVDDPELCSVITPAIVDRNPLLIAITSGGAVPVLARRIKQMLELELPESLGRLASFCRSLREKVKQTLPESRRRYFWEAMLEGRVPKYVESGDLARAEALADQLMQAQSSQPRGEVYLVGAGPGAPDLLTLRALQLMQRADVVLYDRLVSPPDPG